MVFFKTRALKSDTMVCVLRVHGCIHVLEQGCAHFMYVCLNTRQTIFLSSGVSGVETNDAAEIRAVLRPACRDGQGLMGLVYGEWVSEGASGVSEASWESKTTTARFVA